VGRRKEPETADAIFRRRFKLAPFLIFLSRPLVCFARIEAIHFPGIEVTTPNWVFVEGKTAKTSNSDIQSIQAEFTLALRRGEIAGDVGGEPR
jgi:hypothetical protein